MRLIKPKLKIIDKCPKFSELETVYLKIHCYEFSLSPLPASLFRFYSKYSDNPNIPNIYDIPTIYIITSRSALRYDSWKELSQFECEKNKWHLDKDDRILVEITCGRTFSKYFLALSEKYGSGFLGRVISAAVSETEDSLYFIIPYWMKDIEDDTKWERDIKVQYNFLESLYNIEEYYFNLINKDKLDPKQAKAILPECSMQKLYVSGFVDDWKLFIENNKNNGEVIELLEPLMKIL